LLRILVVDDNAMMRGLLRTALEKQPEWVVVGEARNGRDALQSFSDHKPNVTVMDYLMPVMDGLEASRRLSARYPNAPILMVTTDPSKQLQEEARKSGIKGLCPKSEIHCLLQAVETIVKGQTYFREEDAAAGAS
jgi:DNA-binding NarL/FixJ family response regulator